MNIPLINYHSHTLRCQHSYGTEEAYVKQAIETGYSILGFADHSPWPYKSDFISSIRMTVEQFPDYVHTIRALGEKYADKIHIPLGLECEAFPEYFGWLADIKAEFLDYVIMGNHYEINDETGGQYFGHASRADQIRRYAECTIAGMKTGLYNYIAHPDLFCRFYPKFDAECMAVSRDLCAAAKDLNIPLEYNLLGKMYWDRDKAAGGLGYPCHDFWNIAADMGCKVIIGQDVHRTEHLAMPHMYREAWTMFHDMGMEIVEDLRV